MADAYLNDQVEHQDGGDAARQRLAGRADARGQPELVRSEETVEAIRRKYGLLETDRGAGVTTDRQTVTDLNTQLTQAQADVAARRARYEQAERMRRRR